MGVFKFPPIPSVTQRQIYNWKKKACHLKNSFPVSSKYLTGTNSQNIPEKRGGFVRLEEMHPWEWDEVAFVRRETLGWAETPRCVSRPLLLPLSLTKGQRMTSYEGMFYRLKKMDTGVRGSGLESWLPHVLATWLWARYWTCWRLSFLICEMGTIVSSCVIKDVNTYKVVKGSQCILSTQ